MASIMKILCVVLVLFNLVIEGSCQCGTKDIKIEQSRTGELVQEKPEWSVTVNNDCYCSQLDVDLYCKGFQTVKPVDISILSYSKTTGQCLVNDGQPLYPFTNLTFTYAWDSSFPFAPLSSQVACS